jgi:hypothetical protein
MDLPIQTPSVVTHTRDSINNQRNETRRGLNIKDFATPEANKSQLYLHATSTP